VRGLVPGLPSPHPLGPALPGIYLEDDFTQRFVGALDEVLAPIFGTLDNFDSYLDPDLAPDDFVTWLGTWVGALLDESWSVDRRRAVVASAVDLYRMRGTAASLAAQIEIHTGGSVEIVENGGTAWSVDPGGELPGSPGPAMIVRVHVPDPKAVDVGRLDALVGAAKPAHVAHQIEVVGTGSSPRSRRGSGGSTSDDGPTGDGSPANGAAEAG
jgi:phage tail-like protein